MVMVYYYQSCYTAEGVEVGCWFEGVGSSEAIALEEFGEKIEEEGGEAV